MTSYSSDAPKSGPEQRLEKIIRRALATPPISNEEIVLRSKKQRGKR